MSIETFLDRMSLHTFGMTLNEAHEKRICIACKKKPVHATDHNRKEYELSGLCGNCWDNIMKEDK